MPLDRLLTKLFVRVKTFHFSTIKHPSAIFLGNYPDDFKPSPKSFEPKKHTYLRLQNLFGLIAAVGRLT